MWVSILRRLQLPDFAHRVVPNTAPGLGWAETEPDHQWPWPCLLIRKTAPQGENAEQDKGSGIDDEPEVGRARGHTINVISESAQKGFHIQSCTNAKCKAPAALPQWRSGRLRAGRTAAIQFQAITIKIRANIYKLHTLSKYSAGQGTCIIICSPHNNSKR